MSSQNDAIAVPNLFKVDGLVAVVTGGGTGIGLMIARALALNNASKIYIIGRRASALLQAASTVPTRNIIPLVGDVTSTPDLERMVAEVKREAGAINLLVANAGIFGPKIDISQDMTPEQIWEAVRACPQEDFTAPFAVNVTSVYYCAMAFLPLLVKGNESDSRVAAPKSQIIVTSSVVAFARWVASEYAYRSSKAAVTHLAKMLATFLVPYDVRVNAIAPGFFPSEMVDEVFGGAKEEWLDRSELPARRLGDERDMAGTVLYLASTAGAYNNGNVLLLDGGRAGVLPGTY